MSVKTMKPDSQDPCCCSPCASLQTAERPLFGTGQTLTAADLTSLQNYVKTKNRLHNRYLHGYGVVCGLEVLCHDCEGSVTIRPGYAIDPCGEDIVVTDAIRYDVIKAIRDCTQATRKRTSDCDPWAPPQDEGCDGALTHWCIAVRYREVETAIGQRLTSGGQACTTIGKGNKSCACSSGESSGSNKCETPRTRVVSEHRPSALAASNACAPRRIQECFDVTLIPHKGPCEPSLPNRDQKNTTHKSQPLGLIGWLIPEKSLLRNIIDCVVNDVTALTERLTDADSEVLSRLASSSAADLAASNIDLDAVHSAICHVRAAVLEALQDDYGATRCQLLRATAEARLAAPARNTDTSGAIEENRAEYIARAQDTASDLLAAWIQAILDCICRAFLPRVPEDPCDDRVELACISVKDGKILSICNHSCRKYAGAFPSTFYWMSLVPIIPLFAKLLAMLCCRPDMLRRNSPLVNDLLPLLDRVDPTGNLRREIVKNNFSLPRRYVAMAAKFANTPVISAISAQLQRAAEAVIKPSKQRASAAKEPQDTTELRKELMSLKEEVSALRSAMAKSASPSESSTGKSKPTKPE